jgi:peptide-methionine (R)-S-oxide reductase
MPIARRHLLTSVFASGLAFSLARPALAANPSEKAFDGSPFRKFSLEDWRRRLPPASFAVLRQEDTERPFTSPLLNEHRRGTFVCLGCDLPLFRSEWKYDSGTGWPSFFQGMDNNIGRKLDMQIGYPRTEYHCARCLGHQGHLFDDGPKPTGLRFCNNGVALKFVAG